MAKTTALEAATLPLSGAELVPIVQDGESKYATAAAIANPTSSAASALRKLVKSATNLPIGWIEPNDYTNVVWVSGFAHKRYCDGLIIWCMLPDTTATRTVWRIAGGPRVRNPDDGIYYIGVNMASVYNPTLQGVAVTERWVDVNTGNDANAGTEALPFKTVDFAIAAANALGAGTYDVKVKSNDFIPSNSEGWNATSFTLGVGVKLSITILAKGDGSQPWVLPGMRRSGYMKPNWAFTLVSDGLYKCATGAIGAAAKNTPISFDLLTLNDDGSPTPGEGLTGVLADDAAVLATSNGRPVHYRRVSDETFYLRLASGAEPEPGVNFGYVENQSSIAFLLNEGSRIYIRGLRMVHNTSVVTTSGIQFRPANLVLGPTQPVVVHDIQAVLEDCEFYGLSGNAVTAFDINRFVMWNCKDAYCWLDGPNASSYYEAGNSNDPQIGSAQHALFYNHISRHHGPNGFKDQPTVNTSSNTITVHSRINGEALNCILGDSYGSGIAVVGGARLLELNTGSHSPKYVTPGTDVYAATRLASGNSAYTTAFPSEIIGIYGSGSCRPNARDFYVGPTAKMIQANYQNRSYRKQVQAGGILEDGYGAAL